MGPLSHGNRFFTGHTDVYKGDTICNTIENGWGGGAVVKKDHFIIEPRHEISNNVVCATSKASGQPVQMCRLIGAFASRLDFLGLLSY